MKKITFLEFLTEIVNTGTKPVIYNLSDVVDNLYYKIRSEGSHKYKLIDYDNARFTDGTLVTNTKENHFKFNAECVEQAKKDNKNVSLLKTSHSQRDGTINGWFYRVYKDSDLKWNIAERLSLNVYMDQNLIKRLDEIVEQDKGTHIVQYKVPMDVYHWAMRHDPVTIYFSKLTPSLLQEIVEKVKPYLRPEYASVIIEEKNPYNVNLPKGIYYNKEPQPEQVKFLLDKVKNVLPDMENELKLDLQIRSDNITSVATYRILMHYVYMFQKYADKIDPQSIYDYYKKRKEDYLKYHPDFVVATDKLVKRITADDIENALNRIANEKD